MTDGDFKNLFSELLSNCNNKSNSTIELFDCLYLSCQDLPVLYRSKFSTDIKDSDIIDICLEELNIFKLSCNTEDGVTKCRWCKGDIISDNISIEDKYAHGECHEIMISDKLFNKDEKLRKFVNILKSFPQFDSDKVYTKPMVDRYLTNNNIFEFNMNIEPIGWNDLNIKYTPVLEEFEENGQIVDKIDNPTAITFVSEPHIDDIIFGKYTSTKHLLNFQLQDEFAKWNVPWVIAMKRLTKYLPYSYIDKISKRISDHLDVEGYIKYNQDQIEAEQELIEEKLGYELSDSQIDQIEYELETKIYNQLESFRNDDSFRPTDLGNYIDFYNLSEDILDEIVLDRSLTPRDLVDWLNYSAHGFKDNIDFPLFKFIENEFVYLSIPNID